MGTARPLVLDPRRRDAAPSGGDPNHVLAAGEPWSLQPRCATRVATMQHRHVDPDDPRARTRPRASRSTMVARERDAERPVTIGVFIARGRLVRRVSSADPVALPIATADNIAGLLDASRVRSARRERGRAPAGGGRARDRAPTAESVVTDDDRATIAGRCCVAGDAGRAQSRVPGGRDASPEQLLTARPDAPALSADHRQPS